MRFESAFSRTQTLCVRTDATAWLCIEKALLPNFVHDKLHYSPLMDYNFSIVSQLSTYIYPEYAWTSIDTCIESSKQKRHHAVSRHLQLQQQRFKHIT